MPELSTASPGHTRSSTGGGLPRRVKQAIAITTDALMLSACLWIAVALRYGEWLPPVHRYIWLFVLVPALTIPYFRYVGLYRAVTRYTGVKTLFAGVRTITVTAVALAMVIYIQGRFEFPRSAPPIFWLVATLYLIGSRQALHYLSVRRQAAAQHQPIIIYGTDEAAIRLAAVLRASGPFRVVAFVDHAPRFHKGELQDIPVIAPEALAGVIARQNVGSVLLTYTQFDRADRLRALAILAKLPVRVRAVPALGDIVNGLVQIEEFRSIDIADLLGRDLVPPQPELIAARTRGKVVLVTGAAGSIGSAGTCSPVRGGRTSKASAPGPSSSAPFRSLACPARSGPTTACPLPPLASTASRNATCGGCGSAFSISVFTPPRPRRTARTSACIAP